MNFFINSPAYYTQENGVIDDIYRMCSMISKNINVQTYTSAIDTIGISPMIAPVDILSAGEWKERKYISLNYRFADIALISNYELFCNGDILVKKKMIIENIIESLKVIKKRLKGKFNYDLLVQDIQELVLSEIGSNNCDISRDDNQIISR